jgi:hypothetical protein
MILYIMRENITIVTYGILIRKKFEKEKGTMNIDIGDKKIGTRSS